MSQVEQIITLADYRRICVLHVSTLPTSNLSSFSFRSLETIYKYAVMSKQEQLFLERDDSGEIIAVAFVSLAPSSFLKRLMIGSSFLIWFLLGFNKNVFQLVIKKLFEPNIRKKTLLTEYEIPELMFIFSDPNVRSQGCGRQLLKQIEGYLTKNNMSVYEVKTEKNEDNRALSFYERNGFKRERVFKRMGSVFQTFRKDIHSSSLI